MRRLLWLGGAFVMVVAACGGASHHGADPTTTLSVPASSAATTSTSSTAPAATTSTVPDPVDIPATIDAAYVNAVLAQLNHVYGNAQRIEIATKFLPKSIPPLLRAIFGDAQYTRELSVFSQALLGNQLSTLSPKAGDRQMVVVTLSHHSSECIGAAVVVNYKPVDPVAGTSARGYVVLRPKVRADDPGLVNETPWMIFFESNGAPGPGNAC